MSIISPDQRQALDELILWWEDAGISVDRREIGALLKAGETFSEEVNHAANIPQVKGGTSPINDAQAAASGARDLADLNARLEAFEGCDLKKLCERTVFADGVADADIMVIGEGPGRDEDMQGKPFVGRAGQLLDKMLSSIGLSRTTNTYITNVNFWRPPGNRNPTEEELAICRPFVDKHIALKAPELIIAAGAVPAKSLLGVSDGIMKLRGKAFDLTIEGVAAPIPFYPILHPAYLLRRPAEKARAWADLLNIQAKLEALGLKTDK